MNQVSTWKNHFLLRVVEREIDKANIFLPTWKYNKSLHFYYGLIPNNIITLLINNGHDIILSLIVIFEKIILKKDGGICFHINSFLWILKKIISYVTKIFSLYIQFCNTAKEFKTTFFVKKIKISSRFPKIVFYSKFSNLW